MPAVRRIEVTCDVADTLPLDRIMEFQGEFKKHDQYDIANIIKSMAKYGINFPFFIWRDNDVNYCMDGHGRRLALLRLRDQGCTIPDVPVVYVHAQDLEEAVQKLLRLNSRYGTITENSVADFIGNIAVELSELAIPDVDIIEFADTANYLGDFFSDTAPPKEKVIKRCPYCGGILK
jgi:hypothetical protein